MIISNFRASFSIKKKQKNNKDFAEIIYTLMLLIQWVLIFKWEKMFI